MLRTLWIMVSVPFRVATPTWCGARCAWMRSKLRWMRRDATSRRNVSRTAICLTSLFGLRNAVHGAPVIQGVSGEGALPRAPCVACTASPLSSPPFSFDSLMSSNSCRWVGVRSVPPPLEAAGKRLMAARVFSEEKMVQSVGVLVCRRSNGWASSVAVKIWGCLVRRRSLMSSVNMCTPFDSRARMALEYARPCTNSVHVSGWCGVERTTYWARYGVDCGTFLARIGLWMRVRVLPVIVVRLRRRAIVLSGVVFCCLWSPGRVARVFTGASEVERRGCSEWTWGGSHVLSGTARVARQGRSPKSPRRARLTLPCARALVLV